MSQQNKADSIPRHYFPRLDPRNKDATLVVPRPDTASFNTIEVILKASKSLAIMGERVHFFLDFPNEAIYIRGHNPDVDTQAPPWKAKYLDGCISYTYDGYLGEESSKQLASIFEFIEEYRKPMWRVDTLEVMGYYYFEDKTLVFPLNFDKIYVQFE